LRVAGRIALITGAAGGIGQAAARVFAQEGAHLALNDVPGAPWESLTAELEEKGRAFSVHEADVTDSRAVDNMLSEIVARWEGLDIVLANAGINRDGFAAKLSEEDWDKVLNVNLKGCFLICRAAFEALGDRGGGTIVATSSISALGNIGQSNYAASKAGILGLVRSLALEGAPLGIRVNAVAPGLTDTAMARSNPEKVRDKLLARVPLGRMARPDEIGQAMLFLASPESSYITGQVLFVDGGASVGF
jgi:3-oxoacyl-[acyl-carrier protein] reductase